MDKKEFSEKMKGIAQTRMVQGNPPKCGEWHALSSVTDEDGVRWCIHYRPNEGTNWITVKVFANGRARKKANFWIGWNGERSNRSKDTGVMEQQRPELYRLVMDRLREKSAIMGERHARIW